MASGRSKYDSGIKPQWEDIQQFIAEVYKTEERSIRVITRAVTNSLGTICTLTTIQFYTVQNGAAWIEHELAFEWSVKSERPYMSTLLIMLHRAYHAWSTAAER